MLHRRSQVGRPAQAPVKTVQTPRNNQHSLSRSLGLPFLREMIGRYSLQEYHHPKPDSPTDKLQTQKRHLGGYG